ncbi:MAG: PTS sugar transporter subunit IIC [Lachnospiraceae bacterium]
MWKKFEERLIKWAGLLQQNLVLNVISQSFMMIFPFMMIGSIFSLIAGLPFEAWTNMLAETGLDKVLTLPVQYTTEFISIYVSFAMAYNYCIKKGNRKQAISAGLISIFAFMCLIPYSTIGEGFASEVSIPFYWIGSRGMFVAIFVAFFVGWFVCLAQRKKWTIKLPDSVPPFVVNSFSALIPAFAIAFIFVILHFIFSKTTWGGVVPAFYELLKVPMGVVTKGPWGVVVIETVSMTLWWLGIHGGAVTYSTKNILFTENRLANLAAYSAGQPLPNINTGLFLTMGVMPLIFCVMVFSKSKRVKGVGAVALVPAVFGISEPINFGLPTVLNPIMAIPSIIIYPLCVLATYVLNLTGLLPYCNGVQIRNCPYFILSFVQFGGFKGLFWWIVLFVISVMIYLPFVRILDKKYWEEEVAEEGKAVKTN